MAILVLWLAALEIVPDIIHEVDELSGAVETAQYPACPHGWLFADSKCFALFGRGLAAKYGQPLPWEKAKEACQVWWHIDIPQFNHLYMRLCTIADVATLQGMGEETHLASITTPAQQNAASHLLRGSVSIQDVWIGLNNMDEETSFVWTDDESITDYVNWAIFAPLLTPKTAAVLDRAALWRWTNRVPTTSPLPYICAREASPPVASGGFMLGCIGGHWVLGTPYKQVGPPYDTLLPTIVR
eukprot:SAG31_NODE_143_length_22627_cov_14.541347_5_plen_242_part_00